MDSDESSWIFSLRSSDEYEKGVECYLDYSFATRAEGDQISCPCKECYHRHWYRRNEVYNHLIVNGIDPRVREWHLYENGMSSKSNYKKGSEEHEANMHDRIDELLYDTHRKVADKFSSFLNENNDVPKGEPNVEARKFFKLVEDGRQELYPGCKSFSKLSFMIRIYLFKCVHGMSNAAFTELVQIMQEMVPEAKLPKSFYEAKKIVSDLGLGYNKIDACRNDCILYWKDNENSTSCHVCNASRWKEADKSGENENDSFVATRKIPAKVVWHFPLKPRLQRLYMCAETAAYMRWHEEKRPLDGKLRHPADAKTWKDFDLFDPSFAKECRNVRLGLASDGFNPFRTMSTTHSTWPVVLMNYNLPPWLFMKAEYLMLSLIIPGPSSPGNDIDVYLQPLVDELKDLWECGIDTYDSSKGETFKLRAALQSTTSDFPGFAMLSGWSTKGKFACPLCHYETDHKRLNNSKKSCYMGHRRFLDANHHWRRDKKSFNGQVEDRAAPDPLTGGEILYLLQDYENNFGKLQKKKKDENCPWRKKSIFFSLPYWEQVACRHHLDPMHIEKNICDNILGTLLDIYGKTKDHLNARLDLKEMGIRSSLHPVQSSDKQQSVLPKASFSMTKEEKTMFCDVLKKAKLPQGCASNIARCVQVEGRKISGYKSHDAHIIMQYLLQVAVRKTMQKHVALTLIKLSAFLRAICSKVINPNNLDRLQGEVAEVLCMLEKIFPPSFFDIMVHLPIHLVDEVKHGGPVSAWWMYAIERYLGKLKSYVRNRCRPEASIAEGFLAEECLVFCSRYLGNGSKKRSRGFNQSCNEFDGSNNESPIFPNKGHPIGKKKNGKRGKVYSLDLETRNLAHRYVLYNCEDEQVEKYINEHKDAMKNKSKDRRRKTWRQAQQHSAEFMDWLKGRVETVEPDQVPDHIRWLSVGPCNVARTYRGYAINGYKFYTMDRDDKCKTQNSGVTLPALTSSFASSKDQNPITDNVIYYGAVREIIELDYWSCFKVILFRCDWFHVEKDDYGLTRVNFNKLCYSNDPFVLAKQVQQVFYVEDPIEKGWHYAIKMVPKEFDSKEQMEDKYMAEPDQFVENIQLASEDVDNTSWCREGVAPTMVNNALYEAEAAAAHIDNHDSDSDFDDTDWDWMS